mmetsp:Transcript_16082/g.26257  ORF Transcript_16082/g.26257 Transcript_16082/m.26257 type:complete len:207 (-) Transcript_16082:8-628(-)
MPIISHFPCFKHDRKASELTLCQCCNSLNCSFHFCIIYNGHHVHNHGILLDCLVTDCSQCRRRGMHCTTLFFKLFKCINIHMFNLYSNNITFHVQYRFSVHERPFNNIPRDRSCCACLPCRVQEDHLHPHFCGIHCHHPAKLASPEDANLLANPVQFRCHRANNQIRNCLSISLIFFSVFSLATAGALSSLSGTTTARFDSLGPWI